MGIKLITLCPGKANCPFFKSPEDLMDALETKVEFKSLLMATEIVRMWSRASHCQFMVKDSGRDDGEAFHTTICSLASKPPFSMDAVSRGTGYSKTRIAQIEHTAMRKLQRTLGRTSIAKELMAQA